MQHRILGNTRVWVSPVKNPIRETYKQKYSKINTKKELLFTNFNTCMKEKMLVCTCYLTCGLSGLILMLLNFFTNRYTSLYIKFHTIQAIYMGIIIAISAFLLKTIAVLSVAFIFILEQFNQFYGGIVTNFPFYVFCIVCIFAVAALIGKNTLLPGVKNIAHQILKE